MEDAGKRAEALLTAMMVGKTVQRSGRQSFACPCGSTVQKPVSDSVGRCSGCGRLWDFDG